MFANDMYNVRFIDNGIALNLLHDVHQMGASLCIGNFWVAYDSALYASEIDRLYRLVDALSSHPSRLSDTSFESDKITVKLCFFCDKHGRVQVHELLRFISYCEELHILVGFGAMLNEDAQVELETYLHLWSLGVRNIILTIACYRHTAAQSVDRVLGVGGHVRLCKGYYNDYDINDQQQLDDAFYANALKLARSKQWHIFATHDFDLLQRVYAKADDTSRIEVSHFLHAKWYVKHCHASFPHQIAHVSYYLPIGHRLKTLRFWIRYANTRKEICRTLRSTLLIAVLYCQRALFVCEGMTKILQRWFQHVV